MMICRCPGCGTPFRVTPQQIKVRNGLVRCGECKIVFNALDQLVEGQDQKPAAPPLANVTATLGRPPREVEPHEQDPRDLAAHLAPLQAAHEAAAPADEPPTPPAPATESDTAPPPPAVPERDESAAAPEPSADETREAALAAGLVAPRELRTAPGYSRWAETALSKGSGPKLSGPPRSLGWLYGTLAVLLSAALAAQAALHYRTEVATQWPASRPWLERACAQLDCTVALPRKADLISIEASDLHSDPDRGGLLVLQATLRNRAAFTQALPALELTITDTEDRAVARRVLLPDEYLERADGGSKAPTTFAANGELDVRLWIDARDVGAAGYRLYLFYP